MMRNRAVSTELDWFGGSISTDLGRAGELWNGAGCSQEHGTLIGLERQGWDPCQETMGEAACRMASFLTVCSLTYSCLDDPIVNFCISIGRPFGDVTWIFLAGLIKHAPLCSRLRDLATLSPFFLATQPNSPNSSSSPCPRLLRTGLLTPTYSFPQSCVRPFESPIIARARHRNSKHVRLWRPR